METVFFRAALAALLGRREVLGWAPTVEVRVLDQLGQRYPDVRVLGHGLVAAVDHPDGLLAVQQLQDGPVADRAALVTANRRCRDASTRVLAKSVAGPRTSRTTAAMCGAYLTPCLALMMTTLVTPTGTSRTAGSMPA